MEGEFNRYKIQIVDSVCRCTEVNGQQAAHFIAPDTQSGIQKLYVVKDGEDICYVGITSQPMSSRLRIGFIDDGHYGYHGYKWKDKLRRAELLAWTFPDMARNRVEAIEAELVYYIRKRTGNWPRYQMEIHFHEASEEERRIARLILDQCLK
ncbi:MAG: hypothetical protein R6V59_08265 [Dehalococcoidia bacterium]